MFEIESAIRQTVCHFQDAKVFSKWLHENDLQDVEKAPGTGIIEGEGDSFTPVWKITHEGRHYLSLSEDEMDKQIRSLVMDSTIAILKGLIDEFEDDLPKTFQKAFQRAIAWREDDAIDSLLFAW